MKKQFTLFYAALMIGYVGLVTAAGMTGYGTHAAAPQVQTHPAGSRLS